MPPVRDGEALAVGFRVDADLRALGDLHVLVEDRVAHDRAAADVDPVQQHRRIHLRVRVHAHARREDRAPHAAAGDDHAPHTSESTATPVRPSSSNTNLAGGSGSGQLRIGHWLL